MSVKSDIRVLVVTQFFVPEGQGGGYRWQRLIERSSGQTDFHVIAPPPAYPYGEYSQTYRPWKTECIDGIEVTRLWTYQPQTDTGRGRILNYGIFSVIASLYVLMHFWKFDCVVTMSTPHTTFLPGAVGHLLGREWIPDIFDLWLDNAVDFGYIDANSPGYHAVLFLERIAIRWPDRVLVITPTMADDFADKHDVSVSKFVQVPFGVDEELFVPQSTAEVDNRAMYVGNLGALQTFGPYMRGFARVVSNGIDAELYLVGSGERKTELHDLAQELDIEDRVTFTGQVPRDDIPELLSSAAVSWVPLDTNHRLDYARPAKLLESMAVATPYVGSEVDEIKVVTEESDAGIAVPNEPGAVAEAMEMLLGDDEAREAMGERGVEFIDTHHRWERLGEQAERAIRQTVSDGSAA